LLEITAREILLIEQAARHAGRLKDLPSNGDEE
jgi:hypothetical protein